MVLAMLFVTNCIYSYSDNTLKLLPYPQQVELQTGACNLSAGYAINGVSQNVKYLENVLIQELKIKKNAKGVTINLVIDPKMSYNKEAYLLEVTPSTITLTSGAENGIFYAIQTLRQLVKAQKLPCVKIEDTPAFEFRSYMLDDARYFQGVKTVKTLLDEIARLKFNKFHWHLTNDAGWRIEIKKYPLLTEVGSKRTDSQIDDDGKKWESKLFSGKPHEGYYTQQEIREIVKYAEERYITIIPEVSMPGHASAAVASYPWLGTTKEHIEVPTTFGVVSTVFNPADPKVVMFLQDVLSEVSSLFPSSIIHIGGDEVKYGQWEKSDEVKQYMEDHNLPTYSDVQVKFTNDISNFIDQKLNKRMMGWNEIMGKQVHGWSTAKNSETELSSNAIIQFWYGKADNLKLAIDRGHQVVNSHNIYTYLDYTYKQISLQKAYEFNPVPEGLSAAQEKQVIGLGCQMWGEWTPTSKEVEYLTYPRLAAYAEVGWTKKDNKDYNRFRRTLTDLMQDWTKKGYNIASMEEAESSDQ